MHIGTEYLKDILNRLLSTPSPTGDTARGIALCRETLGAFRGLQLETTHKGVLRATWPGRQDSAPRAVTGHIDTLGAMVREIKANGRLRLAQLGSYDWTSIENEAVTIQTQKGQTWRGTVLFVNPSYHVHSHSDRIEDKPRHEYSMEVRIDARTRNAEETRALDIEVGDFVYFDTRTEWSNGFIRSRHIDDKGCLACIFAAVKALHDAERTPAQRTTIHIANYEEVCHGGAAGFPDDIAEILAIDVAPLGADQNSDEYSCSLCLLDDDGPYDAAMNRRLRRLAARHDIPLRPDIFPQFSSDAKAFWKAGGDARVALIGPGTDATHGYERTHLDALVATTRLIAEYLLDEE